MQVSAVANELMQSWRESLKIFVPQNLTQFLLLALNSWRQLWQSLIGTGAILYVAFTLFFSSYYIDASLRAMPIMLVALLAVATRPSVRNKDNSYYLTGFFWAFGITLLIPKKLLYAQAHMGWSVHRMTVLLVIILFLLDSQVSEYAKALIRAAKMLVYNYPFFLTISIVCYFLCELLSYIHTIFYAVPLVTILCVIVYVALISLFVCLVANFYVKRIHEQFDLYYGKK